MPNESSSPAKKLKLGEISQPSCEIRCTRLHLVKIFQRSTTFAQLLNSQERSFKIQNCPDPFGLATILDELCDSVMDQAQLTCHRTVSEGALHRFDEIILPFLLLF